MPYYYEMLFGNESISYYSPGNIIIWMSMAFQAGLINIGAFMACHRFVSHVTGFATYFGYEMSAWNVTSSFSIALVPIFFFLGAMISGQLVDIRLKLHKRPKYYITFGIIFFLIAAVSILGFQGYFGEFGEPLVASRDYMLLIILCLICGIQNGTITTISKSVIRTTHLTGITTDLAIGVVRFLNQHKMKIDMHEEMKANLMRSGIIFFFIFGSIFGGVVFAKWKYLGFIFPALTSGALFCSMLYFQVFKARNVQKSICD